MTLDKKSLVDSIHKIICTTTRPNSDSKVEDNSYFKRRVQGFNAENEFDLLINQKGKKFLEGGQFISQQLDGKENSENKFIYTTVSFEPPAVYNLVYQSISKWNAVTQLFYIQILEDNWTTEDYEVKEIKRIKKKRRGNVRVSSVMIEERSTQQISKPAFKFFSFDKIKNQFIDSTTQDFTLIFNCFPEKEKNRKDGISLLREKEKFEYLEGFDSPQLKKLYATRYFMDVILRKLPNRNIIDLDGFISSGNELTLVEIKEKSPIKKTEDKTTWSYGWDTRRILWYEYLISKTNINFLYIIRRIEERTDRKFEGWNSISLENFLKAISWSFSTGGGGAESTLTAPYLLFDDFEKAK